MARYRRLGGIVAAFILLWQGCALAGDIKVMTADQIAQALSLDAFKDIPVKLGGNTDVTGSDDYNQTLSERRAAAARAYLAQAHNLDPEKLKAVGFGKTQLDPRYPPNAAEQRRVTVELVPGQ